VDGSEQATGTLAAVAPLPAPELAVTSEVPASGTSVMPATLIPDPEPGPDAPRPGTRRGVLVALVAGLLALVVGAAAFGGGDLPVAPTTTVSQPSTTVASTTTTTAPLAVPPADDDDDDDDEDDEAPPGKGRGEKDPKDDD